MRHVVLGLLLVLAPGLAVAATPAEGVALKVRRGFFTETDVGGFVTVGGDYGNSNLQTYLQLGVGYDISEVVEIGLHVGIGANASNCFAGLNPKNDSCLRTDNFTMTFIDLSGAYLVNLAERLYVAPKVVVGYTLLEPAPVERSDQTPVNSAINAGLGVGVEYATNMDHFSIGFDVIGRYVVGLGSGLNLAVQFFPRVKYTF